MKTQNQKLLDDSLCRLVFPPDGQKALGAGFDDVTKSLVKVGLSTRGLNQALFGLDHPVTELLRTNLLPQVSVLPRFNLYSFESGSHGTLEPIEIVSPRIRPKRGRPPGSPDDEFVSFGVEMVLCGEAKTGQEAARMVVDIHGFQPRGGLVKGSTPEEAINRLGRKIREEIKR